MWGQHSCAMKRKPVFYVIKLNRKLLLLVGVVLLLIIGRAIFRNSIVFNIFKYQKGETIVVDPGHGGIDGGTSDKTGLLEKDINLDVGLKLKKELLVEGFRVLMTREKDESLEERSKIDSSRYRRDLDARKTIINENNSTTYVSIHVNSSPSSKAKGIKIYYYPGSTEGEMLADSIRQSVDTYVYERYLKDDTFKAEIIPEDYFILRETEMAGVLVEIGFITNPEENKLLQNERYKRRVAYAIKKGIIEYLKSGQGDG